MKFRAYLLLSLGHSFAKLFVRAGVCLSFCAVRYRCTVAFVSHLWWLLRCAEFVCVSLRTHWMHTKPFPVCCSPLFTPLYLPFSEASLR